MKAGRAHRSYRTMIRFREMVNQIRTRHPTADTEMLTDIADAKVSNDEGMRRAVVKAALVNALNYNRHKTETEPPESDVDVSEVVKASTAKALTVTESVKAALPRRRKSAEEKEAEKEAAGLVRFNIAMTYLMPDGKPMKEHTTGEVLDHFAGRHDELQKVVARFGRDVVLKTLSDADIASAIRAQ
jgi:hypothetical protein